MLHNSATWSRMVLALSVRKDPSEVLARRMEWKIAHFSILEVRKTITQGVSSRQCGTLLPMEKRPNSRDKRERLKRNYRMLQDSRKSQAPCFRRPDIFLQPPAFIPFTLYPPSSNHSLPIFCTGLRIASHISQYSNLKLDNIWMKRGCDDSQMTGPSYVQVLTIGKIEYSHISPIASSRSACYKEVCYVHGTIG